MWLSVIIIIINIISNINIIMISKQVIAAFSPEYTPGHAVRPLGLYLSCTPSILSPVGPPGQQGEG